MTIHYKSGKSDHKGWAVPLCTTHPRRHQTSTTWNIHYVSCKRCQKKIREYGYEPGGYHDGTMSEHKACSVLDRIPYALSAKIEAEA